MKSLLVLLTPAFLFAQVQPRATQQNTAPTSAHAPGPLIPPDDRNLDRLFFGFYDGLIAQIENANAQDAAAGAKTQTAAAHLLKISEADLTQATGIIRAALTQLAQSDSSRQNYQSQVHATGSQPDPAQVAVFAQQRAQIVDTTVQQLTSALPPSSWNALHSFINNDFRLHTGIRHP